MTDVPPGPEQPAETRGDYRFFRSLTVLSSRATVAGLVFLGWYLIAYRLWNNPVDVPIFLLTTTMLAVIVSILAGLTAYALYKRRGGRVEKNLPPPGVVEKRKHFGP